MSNPLCSQKNNTVTNTNQMKPALFFFFFQAEDGIRDLTVTGVQTCALPISHSFRRPYEWALGRELDQAALRQAAAALVGERSEERRVGKECRSRWSPYH